MPEKTLPKIASAVRYNRKRPYSGGLWKRIQTLVGSYPDGIPGVETALAVGRWQDENGLIADCMVGPITLSAMKEHPDAGDDRVFDTTIYARSQIVHCQPYGFGYIGDMAIDCDGAPNAYRPNDRGIDWCVNAGWNPRKGTGRAWGLHLDARKLPMVYPRGHKYAGNYISTTALVYPNREIWERYVDASQVPYVALPGNFRSMIRAVEGNDRHTAGWRKLAKGDLVLVYYVNGSAEPVWAAYADVAPDWTPSKMKTHVMGEGSPMLAEMLGHDPYDVRDGVRRACVSMPPDVAYLVFPGTKRYAWNDLPLTAGKLESAGYRLMSDLGVDSRQKPIDAVLDALG